MRFHRTSTSSRPPQSLESASFTSTHEQQDRDIDSYALHQAADEELRYRGFWELGDPLLSAPGGLIEQLVSIPARS